MIKTTFSLTSHLLCRSVLIPVSCSMMLNASSVAADDDPPGLKPADPAIAQYFKRRDNFNDFKQRREEFYRQMKDVEALVEETPETNAGESLSDSRKARIAAMKQRFEERAQKRQERRGRLANRVKPSETLFRERYAEIQKKLEAYRNASNSSDRRASLAALKEELQALKKEPKQRQNSYQKEVINDNEDATRKPDPTKLKHFRDNLQVLPDALKTSSLVEEEESWSLQNMAQRSLFTILNTLIPTASAADYRRPEPGSGVQACYANGSAHQANIAADLDIAQPELALDPETYAMVTALAAELNYSPVKIYEYVINSFDYEVYLGSVKGVKGMLESGAGNDVDHASLLIALLRASGIPARYTANLAIIEDKPAHNNWHRAESFKANWAMRGKGAREAYPFMTSDSESVSEFDAINGVDIFYSAQAQVTACVPANNYRGSGSTQEGYRWFTLDASFKEYEKIEGVSESVNFDTAAFLSHRTRQRPLDAYENQLMSSVAAKPDRENVALMDIGHRWEKKPVTVDFLPDSLPYLIALTVPMEPPTATLPEKWEMAVRVTLGNEAPLDIPLRDFARHRMTLSFEGVSASDKALYRQFIDGEHVLSCETDNMSVQPVIKRDGTVIHTSPAVSLCKSNEFQTIPFDFQVYSADIGLFGESFGKFASTVNHYAFTAYPFNGSSHYINKRSSRLLNSVNQYSTPSENPDETIGEFLHIALTKYMRYDEQAAKRVARLRGNTPAFGFNIGATIARADVRYVGDKPYALQSYRFIADMPGFTSVIVNGAGELDSVGQTLLMYQSSHSETYIWQENAEIDAISTITGLQIANELEIPVQRFNDLNALLSFIQRCSPEITEHCYDDEAVSGIASYFLGTQAPEQVRMTIPQIPIKYSSWEGYVYLGELKKNITSDWFASAFMVDLYDGGIGLESNGLFVQQTPVYSTGMNFGLNLGMVTGETGYQVPVSDNDLNMDMSFLFQRDPNVGSGIGLGNSPLSVNGGDPVNMVTGNMWHEETDFQQATRGLDIIFKRTYNSSDVRTIGPFGTGWTHTFNQFLEFKNGVDDFDRHIVWRNGNGSEKLVKIALEDTDCNGDATCKTGALNITEGNTTIPNGFYFSLSRPHTSGTLAGIVITEKSGIRYTFENVKGEAGDIARLTTITDRNGLSIQLTYEGDRLITISDADNRTVTFGYDNGSSLIRTISLDWANTVYEYVYDDQGRLTGYRNPKDRKANKNSTTYTYYEDGEGYNVKDRMKTFGYANGYQMTFEYYANGQTYRHYNSKGETASFTYNRFLRESTFTNERGGIDRHIFDPNGSIVEMTGPEGGRERYAYEHPTDPMLRTKVTDAMGYVTEYGYDDNGNLISETLPSGDSVEYLRYNAFGQPQLIKNALGNYRLNQFDSQGNLTDNIVFTAGFGATVDPASFNPQSQAANILSWTRYEYDANGKQTHMHQVRDIASASGGPSVQFDYTDAENKTEGIVPTTISYSGDVDGDGSVASDEGLGVYHFRYDALGRLVEGVNDAFYPVNFRYDDAGRIIESDAPYGGKQRIQYDASGLPIVQSLIAPVNGRVTIADNALSSYDSANRKVSVTDAAGAVSHFEYDAAGNMTKATSPDGFTVYFEYDGKNRVTRAYDEEGNTVKRTLDLVGRLRTLTDPNGNTTKYTYYGPDNNGRLKTVEDAEKRKTTFEYNAAGQVTRVVDNANRETLSEYDALGRAVRVVSPVYEDAVLGAVRPVTTYTYNTLGHQSAVYAGYTTHVTGVGGNDQLKVQATYNYDDYGRVLKSCDALNQCSTQTYDKHSNVLTSTTPIGQVTTYDYGVGGLLINQHTAGVNGQADETISYQYNALGQPLEVISNNVTYTYTYDRAHRVKTVTDSRGNKSVSYDYSAGGLLNQIQDSNGNSTRYLYDPTGRLTGIRTADQGLVSYIYDAGGRLQQKVFPNDLTTAYTYFKDNKIKSITTRKGSEWLFHYSYEYNKAGETSRFIRNRPDREKAEEIEYEYDGLGRLTEANDYVTVKEVLEGGAIRQYGKRTPLDTISYDPYGNRRERTVDGETHVYSHNDLHQITGIKNKATDADIATFAYDANGNMVSKTEGSTVTALKYDALDRLTSVNKTGLQNETYAYDHGIRRIKKAVGSDVQQFHYSGPDIIAEYGSNWDTANAVYSHGAAVDDPLLRLAANDPRYYHADGLGSITAVSNGKGEIVASNEYDHWGNITASTGTTPQFGYTGREPDATGLVYYRNRYYDPQIGRFTQLDPKGFIDGVNRYTYVMNSPVNYVDPWGLSAGRATDSWDNSGFDFRSVGGQLLNGIAEYSPLPIPSIIANGAIGVNAALEGNWAGVGNAALNILMSPVKSVTNTLKVGGKAVDLGKSAYNKIAGVFSKSGGAKKESNPLIEALSKAEPTQGHPNQLMYKLDDGSKLLFRKDFDDKAHGLGGPFQGKGDIDHYNIQLQKPRGGKDIENLHIIPDGNGGFIRMDKNGKIKK